MSRFPALVACMLAALLALPSTAVDEPLDRLHAQVETAPNFDDEAGGDADADDPAIWVNPARPQDSVLIGTVKNGGLTVFDLRGRERQHIGTPPGGRFGSAAITTTPLGRAYPNGLLVLHTGENTPDDGRTSTNLQTPRHGIGHRPPTGPSSPGVLSPPRTGDKSLELGRARSVSCGFGDSRRCAC